MDFPVGAMGINRIYILHVEKALFLPHLFNIFSTP